MLFRIILDRDAIDKELRNEQECFHPNRFCGDQIAIFCIIEKSTEIYSPFYFGFVDYDQDIYNIDRHVLWKLMRHGIPQTSISLVRASQRDIKCRGKTMIWLK